MNTAPDGRNEPLEELFGSVYELAGAVAWQIGRDEVEARLRRVLRQAGHPGQPRETAPGAGESLVTRLVSRAAADDQDAWNEIVERYAPLVYAICRRYRLSDRDIEAVGQQVWALLAQHIGRLREPAALPGWLVTTTARECLRALRPAQRPGPLAGWQEDQARFADDAAIDAEILAAERDAALRAAMAELPLRGRRLLAMLMHDPPYSYREISAELGIPVGSIGPLRARCMDRLRRSMALAPYREDRPLRDDRPQ
jgi:RNA polymerase sigma factor (sigma-70 family)